MDADRLYESAPDRIDLPLRVVEGKLPTELHGSLLRNGPGIQRAGADALHLLDGYGFVAAAAFDDGRARLVASLVRTPLFEREQRAGRQLARRPFTNRPGRLANLLDLNIANGANHDVIAWGGRIVATDAPGHVALGARTLETQGPTPLDDLKPGATGTLCQMPRLDPATERLVTFTTAAGLRSDTVTFIEFDPWWNVVRRRSALLGAKGVVLHDLAFTPERYVAVELGRLNVGAALRGKTTFYDAIRSDADDYLHVYLVDRTGDAPARAVRLPKGHQTFHLFNAFEDEGTVVFDVPLYERRLDFNVLRPPGSRPSVEAMQALSPTVARCRVRQGAEVAEVQLYPGAHGEAPAVNPRFHGRRHRFGYYAAQTVRGDEDVPGAYFYFHGIGRLDFDTGTAQSWSAGPRRFCSPPAFAARPGGEREDDGWLVAWALDAEKGVTEVLVFDAARVSEGPVARLVADVALPAVSHARFTPDIVVGDARA